MILSGLEIKKEQGRGLLIDPFDERRVNPNSYNLTLNGKLTVYTCEVLDALRSNETKTFEIPEDGFVLEPGKLYLGRTAEYTETRDFVPVIEGRSSIGRLGINIHATAGFGDIGFKGYWTLELSCIQPVVIYPYIRICQISYHTICGDYEPYSGKYQGNRDIQASMLYKDFRK